jgi:hypothetical protein
MPAIRLPVYALYCINPNRVRAQHGVAADRFAREIVAFWETDSARARGS